MLLHPVVVHTTIASVTTAAAAAAAAADDDDDANQSDTVATHAEYLLLISVDLCSTTKLVFPF